jgi:hypothetical protein
MLASFDLSGHKLDKARLRMISKRLGKTSLIMVSLMIAIYFGSFWETGRTVERHFDFYEEAWNRSGIVAVSVAKDRGWFSSRYVLDVRLLAQPTVLLPLVVEVKHDFLKAHFYAELDKQAANLTLFKEGTLPFILEADVSLDPFTFDASSSGKMGLSELSGHLGQTDLNTQPSQISWRSTPTVVEFSAKIGDLVFQSEAETVELESANGQINGAFEPSGDMGTLISELVASFSFKRLFWQDKLNNESLKLDNVVFSVDQMVDAGRSLWSIGLGANQLRLELPDQSLELMAPNAQMTIDLNEALFAQFIAQYNQLYEPTPYEVAELLNPVTQQGVTITVHDLSFELLGEQAKVKAKWILDGFDASTVLLTPAVLVPVSHVDARIEVPYSLEDQLPPATNEELDHLINQGVFVEDVDHLISEIRFDRGALMVNDRPFSLLKM